MKRLLSVFVAIAMIASGAAHAQVYPDRPVTIIVPFAAGSGSDTAARVIGQHLTQRLGQTFVVENRVGATGVIASTAVAHTKPDGYTLLLGTNSTHGTNPSLYKSITYDPVKDFVAVAHTGDFAYFLVVNPDLPIKSVADLVAYGNANPGKLSYAAGSSTSIVMAETFAKGIGQEIVKVPYRSNPPALTDVMAGRVSMMFVDISTSLSFVTAGTLRALAVTSIARSGLKPDMPTIDETAVKGFDIASWTGIYAPTGTPKPIVDKLNAEINTIIAMPEVKEQFTRLGIEPKPKTPVEFATFTSAEVEKWTRLVKQAGIQPE